MSWHFFSSALKNKSRFFQTKSLYLAMTHPRHPVIPPQVWCLIGVYFRGPVIPVFGCLLGGSSQLVSGWDNLLFISHFHGHLEGVPQPDP